MPLALRGDLDATLGVPHMLFALSPLYAWPGLLEQVWEAIKPAVATGDFFHAAQRVQADAYTRMFNYFAIPDLHSCAARDVSQGLSGLIDFAELFQTRTALYLVLLSLAAQALEGPVGRAKVPAALPAVPLFAHLRWDEESTMRGRTSEAKQIQRDLKLSAPNPEYLVLRRWPTFFLSYRNCLSTVAASPVYANWQQSTRSLAWHLPQELPGPVEVSRSQLARAGVHERELDAVGRAMDNVLGNLSELLLNMAVARIGLEKGSRPAAASVVAENSIINPERVA